MSFNAPAEHNLSDNITDWVLTLYCTEGTPRFQNEIIRMTEDFLNKFPVPEAQRAIDLILSYFMK